MSERKPEDCIRMKLTMDSMRWDSLKLDPSTELEEKILQKMPVAAFEALQKWQPIEVVLHDVDTEENYSVKLAKKEAFWFEPLPGIGERNGKAATMEKFTDEAKDFAYSIQPFRHIIKKRSLSYDQEIGLVWSGSANVNRVDFSVLYVPRFGSISFFKRHL